MHPTPAPTGGSQPDAIAPDNTNGDNNNDNNNNNAIPSSRRDSMSQKSEGSQTAADFIRDQMQLEADAREALPYSFRDCTRPLGSLRQNVYACLTCNPPPANPDDPYTAAGVCYSCSVQCHGEHELVELFKKRNFVCDCGTTRFSPDQPCRIRINPETNTRGNVHSEQPDPNNKYNQNFRNRFCSCSIDYRPHEQTGTMFQCLGLGTHETGGCGEEWYHPGCLVGQGPKWYEGLSKAASNGALAPIAEDPSHETNDGQQANGVNIADGDDQDEDVPLPDGFPNEDEFELLFCYKCVEAYPWIKRYVGTPGFLPPVFLQRPDEVVEELPTAKKRKLGDDGTRKEEEAPNKRIKSDPNADSEDNLLGSAASDDTSTEVKGEDTKDTITPKAPECKLTSLPPAPNGVFSIFVKADFRDHFCRCPSCFPYLKPHPQLLEQEEDYDPPLSDGSENESTHGSGSLYERGESALKNVDRVRAIEGVMAYNNLKEKLKPFFQQFAESGKAIGAEDIKEYFAKLRGDDQAIKEASESAKEDHRREQSGY